MPPMKRQELWEGGKDETVEVNQRALIDSTLPLGTGSSSMD